jgi:Ferredoxin-like domain in Api92-like protein
MPNHVTNQLKIIASTPERLQEVREFIRGEEDGVELPIDFNKIVPMPESLRIESGSRTDNGLAVLLHRQGDSRKLREMLEYHWVKKEGITDINVLEKRLVDSGNADLEGAQQAIKNLELYGHKDWYSWANDKWGTKWNAYDQNDDGETISFDTAWRTPLPVFEALSRIFPDVQFNVRFADEDLGHNVGEFTLLDGEGVYEDMPEGGSFEALLMASDIKGYDDFFVDECLDIDPDYDVDDLSDRERRMIALVYENRSFDEIENFPKAVLEYLLELAINEEEYEIAAKIKESGVAPE